MSDSELQELREALAASEAERKRIWDESVKLTEENDFLAGEVVRLRAENERLTGILSRAEGADGQGAQPVDADGALRAMVAAAPEPLGPATQPGPVFEGEAGLGNLVCVRWSADGSRLAVGGAGQRVCVLDPATGLRSVAEDRALGGAVLSLDWRPVPGSSTLAATTMDGGAFVFDADAPVGGVQEFRCHGRKFASRARWAPDGSMLATAGYDHAVQLYRWDGEGVEPAQRLEFPGNVEAIEWLAQPALTLVVSVRDSHELRFVDAASGEVALRSVNEESWNDHVSFAILDLVRSADSSFLVAATDSSRHLVMHAGSLARARILTGHAANEYATPRVALSPCGRYLYSNSQERPQVHVWDVVAGAEVAQLQGHAQNVRSLHVCPVTGRVASASYDKTVRVWVS